VVGDSQLDPETLARTVGDLLADPERLERMSAASKALARPDAAQRIAGEVLEAASDDQ
jgi:UDP-N-acetylglucosamine--N-acetylmuramyl-(pentapeptide) pyrophosphoryl-undecaprenol N-acetylglucosamine transferase